MGAEIVLLIRAEFFCSVFLISLVNLSGQDLKDQR